MRASLGQKALGLQTVNAADGATLTRPQAVRRWAVPVRHRRRRLGPPVRPQRRRRSARLGSLIGLAGLRLPDLPAVDDVPEPEAAGLSTTSRPARSSSSAAKQPDRHRTRTGPASPAPFRFLRARSPASGRGAAGTPRAAAGRTRRPAGSTAARRSRRAARPRAAAGARRPRAAAPTPRARSSLVGGTSRIAPATSAWSDGLASPPRRARAGAAGPAPPSPSAPSSSGSSARANHATAARWLRSAASAAATTADGSSRIATQRSPGRRPASRRAIDRPSSDSRPWLLRPMPTNGNSGAASCSSSHASSGRGDDRRLRRALAPGVPVQPLEEVGVEQDRGARRGRHMTTYSTTLDGRLSRGARFRPPSRADHPAYPGDRP